MSVSPDLQCDTSRGWRHCPTTVPQFIHIIAQHTERLRKGLGKVTFLYSIE
jgi:hypothetical protein